MARLDAVVRRPGWPCGHSPNTGQAHERTSGRQCRNGTELLTSTHDRNTPDTAHRSGGERGVTDIPPLSVNRPPAIPIGWPN